jgi:DNA-binding Lrp family transcriptional regulator
LSRPVVRLDEWDRKILRLLQVDADLSPQELARRVGSAPDFCAARLQALERSGTIRSRVALIDAAAAGLDVTIFAIVRLKKHSAELLQQLEQEICRQPWILECYATFGEGDGDYVLKIVAPSLAQYRQLLTRQLLRFSADLLISSIAVLETVKTTTALPL